MVRIARGAYVATRHIPLNGRRQRRPTQSLPFGSKRKNTARSPGMRSNGVRTRLRVYTSVSRPSGS